MATGGEDNSWTGARQSRLPLRRAGAWASPAA